MDEKALKTAVDRFLRQISHTARGEIEKVVGAAVADAKFDGSNSVTAAVALSSEKIGLNVTIYGKITL